MEIKKLLHLQRVQLQSNEDDSDSCTYSSWRNSYLCAQILFILKGSGDEKFFHLTLVSSRFNKIIGAYWNYLPLLMSHSTRIAP